MTFVHTVQACMCTRTYAHTTVRGRERKIEVRVFPEMSSRTRDVWGKCLKKKNHK